MKLESMQQTQEKTPAVNVNEQAVKSLADGIFRHLQEEGCQPKDIINISTQLLGLVTTELKKTGPNQP